MRLRFSNLKNKDFLFDANDTDSFMENGLSALRSFRIMTEKQYHDGKQHKNRSSFDIPCLHIQPDDEANWYNIGCIKTQNGLSFWEPVSINFPLLADSIEQIFELDKTFFASTACELWQCCYDTWRWYRGLNNLLNTMSDALEEL